MMKRLLLFRSALATLIAKIPQKSVVEAGKLLGMLGYVLDRRHNRIVKRNLRFIYPQWPRNRIRRLSKDIFQNMGITLLEICQMACLSREDILRKVGIRGRGNLLNAMKNSKGVILISAHLGNWEMAHIFISCYIQTPLVLVARKIRPKVLNEWVHQVRTRFGSVVLDKAGALPKIARILHHGGPVGVLIDQGTLRSEGVEVAFFGKTVTATPAAAILARRYNSPVLPAFCIREGDGSLTLVVEPPLDLRRAKDMRGDLQVNTQMMNDAIERAVKAYPDQWFWFHKRWKRHYPYLYREDLARRKLQKARKKARLRDI
jgi:KDO2-lipid IV(A) lauroyltransferase